MGKATYLSRDLGLVIETVHSSIVLGGSNDEKLTGIAVADKRVFVTGYTESADFPLARPMQPRLGGSSDAFLTALQEDLESIIFSTYLGGSGDDSAWGVALDPEGNPVIAGITESDDLPVTADAFQKRRGGQADAFLMKLDRSGQRLLVSTYYGGSGLDHAGYDGGNVAVSATGTIWMVGLTNSRDLKVLGGYHSRYGGGEQDGFLIELSPMRQALLRHVRWQHGACLAGGRGVRRFGKSSIRGRNCNPAN